MSPFQENGPDREANLIDSSCLSGIRMLLDANDQAQAIHRPIGDFAIEIADLHQAGLTNHHLRRLSVQGYVRIGVEKTPPGGDHREFRWYTHITLTLPPESCFVLTDKGVVWARAFLQRASVSELPKARNDSVTGHGVPAPFWNRDEYELWYFGNPILSFRKLAPNPFRLFDQFAREGWHALVDNPFDPDEERLRNTVKKLNNRLKGQLLYFVTRVGGRKVGWKIRKTKRTISSPNRT